MLFAFLDRIRWIWMFLAMDVNNVNNVMYGYGCLTMDVFGYATEYK